MSRREKLAHARRSERPDSAAKRRSEKVPLLFGCAGLLFLVLAAYWPALHAGFVWDDDFMLTNNPVVKSPSGLRYIWLSTALPDYFPLTSTSLWVEWKLWGMDALGYHLTNIILHALSAILLWRIFRLLLLPVATSRQTATNINQTANASVPAWLIAAIFAVHPVNVESVAWIAERKNVLAMVFFALTWYSVLKSWNLPGVASNIEGRTYAEPSTINDQPSTMALAWYWLSVLCFLLASLSKTAVVMFPVTLLLFLWWRKRKLTGRDLLQTAPFFALSVALGLTTMWFQAHRAIAGDFIEKTGLWMKLARAAWAFWFYVWKAVFPFRLSFVYPEWNGGGVTSWFSLIATLVLLRLLYHYRGTWGRHASMAFGYFGLMLLPVLGFVPIYFHRYAAVADHWAYFALPALIALGVNAGYNALMRFGQRFPTIRRAGPEQTRTLPATNLSMGLSWVAHGAAVGILLLFALLSFRQVQSFENSERLWTDTLQINPRAWIAHNNLGQILAARGRFDQAIEHYAAALKLKPDQVEIRIDLGSALLDAGRLNEAEQQFYAALKINPNCAMACYNLGNVEDRRGNHAKAIENYRRALNINPRYADAWNNLGCLVAAGGDLEQATEYFRKALAVRPEYADACNNLGSTLTEQGRWLEALSILRRAIELNPSYADPHYNLANALSLGGKTSEAKEEYLAALRCKPSFAEPHLKLGIAFMNDGNAQGAYNEWTEAIRLRPDLYEGHFRLALLLANQRQHAMAIEQYKEALKLSPDWPDALIQLAWILATSGDQNLRDGEEALRLASRAADLTQRKDPAALDALAAAHAELGKFSLAVETEELAATVAEQAGLSDAMQKCKLRVETYRQNKPWRD